MRLPRSFFSPMTTHHFPISIPDLLHAKTVKWARLAFKAGWKMSIYIKLSPSKATFPVLLTQVHFSCSFSNTSLQSVSTTGRGTGPRGAVPAFFSRAAYRHQNPPITLFRDVGLTKQSFEHNLVLTKPARPLAEAQIGGSLVYGGLQ